MTLSKHIKTTNETIREIFIAHGFKIPPELTDMRPYVYEAARALLKHYGVWMTDKPVVGRMDDTNQNTPTEQEAIEELVADAARYRWLKLGKALTVEMEKHIKICAPTSHKDYATALDAAIDMAMKETP